ncbi:Trm112 family protein [Novipirellula artificiosorum]|uniref:Trm112p-like protein n=1 Tax=Novipirellula artificiosorum TaxID=2528016 RepID=A0A5C6E1N6_9BACT|nr:Trm112 family protein [Novipirellula artificiosorum]TWU41049.1 hypothetical protein Poly41_18860 [Novipirellula artificiosorum]
MIDPTLLAILRCPLTGQPLHEAENSLINRINEEIGKGEIRDALDQRITVPIDSGLRIDGGKTVYPIRAGIVCMVADEAIVLE